MNKLMAIVLSTLAVSAFAVDPVTVTWIGGTNGNPMVLANWDPPHVPAGGANGFYQMRITNDVTFTGTSYSDYLDVSRCTIANNATVVFKDNIRFWPAETEKYNPEKPNEIVDVQTGSSLKIGPMLGGKPYMDFIRIGGGTFQTDYIGNGVGAAAFRNAEFREGRSLVGNNVFVTNNFTVCEGAYVDLLYPDSAHENYRYVVNGVLDLKNALTGASYHQTMRGLYGSGVISNATAGITLDYRAQNDDVFDGKIYGRLIIEPHEDAQDWACLTIGRADTLAQCDLEIADDEDYENRIKFAAGIGTFQVKSFPPDLTFYDSEGNPVELSTDAQRFVDVKCEAGGDGLSWESAYHSLAEAMTTDEEILSGRPVTVHVAKGVYADGEMSNDNGASRVIVPANVNLVSAEGAEKTIIMGKPGLSGYEVDDGLDEGAARCVTLVGGARLRGFTLTGGRDYSGKGAGGVYCGSASIVSDCIITNNATSYRGGAGEYGTYIRCYIAGNRASGNFSSALYLGCKAYDCVFDDSPSTCWYIAGNKAVIRNCTFGPGCGQVRPDGQNDNVSEAYNTLFMCNVSPGTPANVPHAMVASNCVFMATVASVDYDSDTEVVSSAETASDRLAYLGLGQDLRPLRRTSYVVNRGKNAYHTLPSGEDGTKDIDGHVRVFDGTIDLGAFECNLLRLGAMLIFR